MELSEIRIGMVVNYEYRAMTDVFCGVVVSLDPRSNEHVRVLYLNGVHKGRTLATHIGNITAHRTDDE